MPESLIPEDRPQRQRSMIPDVPRGRRSITISPDDERQLDEMSYSSAPVKAAPVKQEKPLGLMGTIREGAKSTLRTLGATVDTAQGDAAGVVTAAQEQAAAPKDPDLEKFYAHIDEQKKALGENPSLFEGIKAVGSAAINNPRGFGLMVAEQLPNSAAALGAGAAGALAGSLAGPVGTVAGGLAGLAGANIGLETGSKALEAAQDSQFTPEEQSRVKKEGLIKGGTITGVDALTLGATKFITGTTRRAVERATTKTLADNGVDVTNAAARKAALETPEIADAVKNAQELAKKGSEKLGQTLARTGGAVALETIGEGAGEYLGELAATGKANAVDAVVEGFAGLGTSIGEITATSALNRKGLQRLFDSPETAEKTAEEETKKTGVPHEVIQHPTEPDKFVAVPKVRSVGGIELERDKEGNLKPVQPVSTQNDFNIANKPGFDLTAEDKIREQALNKAREDQYAKNPIIVPGVTPTPSTNAKTIAGKPVSDLSKDALIYTVSRGSARAKQIATDELDRRNANPAPAAPAAPETPTDAVKRIVATGAEKAKEDGKKSGVIVTPAQVAKPAAAPKTAKPVTPKVAKPAAAPKPAPIPKPEEVKNENVSKTTEAAPQPVKPEPQPLKPENAAIPEVNRSSGDTGNTQNIQEQGKVAATLKPKRKSTSSRNKEAFAKLADHFTPGNIVKGYGGYDRVISFNKRENDWDVTVQGVKKDEKGNWVPNGHVRTHATFPDARNTIVERAPLKPEAKPESKAAPATEQKPTEEPAKTEAHPLRGHIESLIKRRAAAKQSGKDRTINSAIDRAKEVMNGTRTDAAREANWFKGHAAVVRKNDPATADILSNISETIKPKTEKVKANEKTENPKTTNEPVRGDKVAVPRGGRILANGIAETIQTKGVAALVGQKITSPERLAELAQVYRNPRYETFRIFFTKGHAIVHASGVTARLPGSTPLFPKDFTDEQGIAWMKEMMKSSGADGYWMLHNHPSGDPKPSPADIKVTGTISQRLPGFKGHVIINSNKYGQITIPRTNPKAEVVIKNFGEDMLLKASKPHPYLGKQVQDPGELSIVGKSFQKEGWVTLVGISGTSGVRAVAEIPAKTFASPGFARAAIRRFARSSGAESIFAHGSPADLKGTSAKLIKEGFLRSAVDDGGKVYGINDKASFGHEIGAGGQELQQPSIRSGKETLEKYGLNPGKKYKTREVAAALESRQREKQGIIAPDDRSDESAKAISKWMTEEVMFEMQHPEKSGVGWYSEKFQRALDVMATEFPEIATDKAARNLLTSLIAITSDGQKVVPNFAMAADLYGNFKTTGKFTTERGHARQASINNNLEILQHLYDTMGPEDMHTYLMQERTVSELKKIAGEAGAEFSSDYQAHIKLPRAAVLLGPKLGAFYANLMGSSGYLTMDRWWSRTFNRYRGTLIQAPTRAGLDRFKQLMGNPSMSDDEVLSAVIAPHDSYAAKKFKEGTEIEKAANTIYKAAFENLEDIPFNSTDRTFMLKTVAFAQKRLSRSGVKMSVADIQAVLWYYEKRLYGELGARQTADVSYEDAARRVVAARAGADRSAGRTIPESGEEESLNDTKGVGEEDYQTLSSGLEQNTSGFSSVNPASPPLRDRLDKVVDTLIYNFQDRFKPLKDIQKRAGTVPESEDASLAEERYSGTVRARTDTFEQQLRDPLLKAIHDSGVSFEGVEQYLHALHAPSRNAAMREINPTEPELKAQTDALEKQRDTLAKDPDVLKYIKTRRELRQAEADIDDGIADESLGRVLKNELAQLQRLQNVKDYSKSLDKLKALRLVKPFQGDNTALSGMSDAESKAILAKIDANGTRKALDKISSIVDTITSKTRQIYVDSGLEKADAIEAWDKKYEHYIPLHRDEVSGNTMPKIGQGFNIRGKESKRATGSNKDVTNILAHVVAQHEAAIIRSEKARVDRTLFQFAKTHPDPSLWTLDSAPMLRTVDPVSGFVVERVDPTYKNRPEVLTLKIDGEEHTITFNDQNQEAMRLAASMKNMSSEQLGEVTQMVGKLTRFLATMNTTMNPVFTARNFLRDLQTTFVNLSDTEIADKKREVFRDVPAAIKGMWALSRGKPNSQWAKYAQEFKSAGGQTGWMDHYKDIGERADTLKKKLEIMKPGKMNATRRTLKAWFDIIQDANNAVENGARLSAFVHARKSGLSEGKAAQIAKNLTVNFNAHGAKGVELNAWYMFMNASIQGTARLAKAMTNRQVRKIVAGVVLSGFLMDILARSMAGDDDEDGENDYDQLPEHVKAMNFVLMVANRPVTIPMPYGYNFFASTGRKISEIMFRDNYSAAKSAVDLAGIFMDAFSPTGQAGSGLQYLSPTVTDPFVQYAENKNFAGNPIRKPQNPFGVPNPEYQMGFKSTSAPGKWLAEALNNITGGNEVRPGFVNVNPAFFDFAVSSIAGGAGRTYLQFASAPLKLANDDEVQAREIPFANIFVGARPEHQTEKKYFEAVKSVELAAEELKTYRAKGDTEMVQEIIHDHRAEIRMTEAAKETKRVLARLRKSDLALDKEDAPNKSELRKALEERKKEAMSKFNKKYREAVAAE